MASGDTLAALPALAALPPSSNYATQDVRNIIPVCDFDDTTQETMYFVFEVPRNYASGGVTVYAIWMATSAVAGGGGTIGWDVSFARMNDANQDVDSLAFAAAQSITAAIVPANAGQIKTTNVAVSNGANMDSVAAGEWCCMRLRRDVANDTAVGDAELIGVEVKET
jgi:hypothetical protein